MFNKIRTLTFVVFAFPLIFAANAEAGFITTSFDELSQGLVHGSITSASNSGQTVTGGFNGFSVSGNNFRDTSNSRNWIVGFDTEVNGSRDSDLQRQSGGRTGWSGGNLDASTVMGNALIIQEFNPSKFTDNNNDGIVDGNLAKADDEGYRPAGYIDFEFDELINSFGFDFIDAETSEVGGYSVEFFDEANSSLATINFEEFDGGSVDNGAEFGNNTANRIVPITAQKLQSLGHTSVESFKKVRINFGGSGAVDNIVYSNAVPEPISFFGWTCLGLTVLSSRRRLKN